MKTTFPAACFLALTLIGCEVTPINVTQSNKFNYSENGEPDYLKPKEEYVEANPKVLGSEFLDRYANQYVTFEATYTMHSKGYFSFEKRANYADIMTANLGIPDNIGQGVRILWNLEDRELGLPFLEAKMGTKLRIYAYVASPNQYLKVKTKPIMVRPFGEFVIWLIQAEVLE